MGSLKHLSLSHAWCLTKRIKMQCFMLATQGGLSKRKSRCSEPLQFVCLKNGQNASNRKFTRDDLKNVLSRFSLSEQEYKKAA